MADQTDFATRIARIEARAAKGAKAEFAPLTEEPALATPDLRRRGLFSGIAGRLIFPLLIGTALVAGFTVEPEKVLPENLVTSLRQSNSPIAALLLPPPAEAGTGLAN